MDVLDGTINDANGNTVTLPPVSPPVAPPKIIPPVNIAASFTIQGAGNVAGQAWSFDGGASYSDDSPLVLYSWDFGDGAGASGNPISHSYGSAGQYEVVLTVRDASGNAAQAARAVTVAQADITPPSPPTPPPTPPTPPPSPPEPPPTPPDGGSPQAIDGPLSGVMFVATFGSACADYNVDPLASAAVAMVEGVAGGTGDGGYAYGPWQMHLTDGNGPGDLKKWEGYGAKSKQVNDWAWSKPGIFYAVEWQANDGARNLRGHEAVRVIVSSFEKPLHPASEIDNAIAVYDDLVSRGGAVWDYLATVFRGPAGYATQPTATPYSPANVKARWRDLIGFWRETPAAISDSVGSQAQDLRHIFR